MTSLLFGILFLILFNLKFHSKREIMLEKYDVEYMPEELLAELLEQEKEMANLPPKKMKVETNRAYNEAEKFISKIENEQNELGKTTEEKMKSMMEAIENSGSAGNGIEVLGSKSPSDKKNSEAQNESKNKSDKAPKSANRRTTISYQLVNRSALDLPNPVYTCEGYGKVVINIEVNDTGRVVKTDYNDGASTTRNFCLIEAAIAYSQQARFTTDPGNTEQIGTITYNFPGQD